MEGDLMEGTTEGAADDKEGRLMTLLSSPELNLIEERVGVCCSEGISSSSDGAKSAVMYSESAEGSEDVR
jgi:hypothetical protein